MQWKCNLLCRVVEARLGSACSFAGMRAKLNELQASNPGIAEHDADSKNVVGKWRKEGAVEPVHVSKHIEGKPRQRLLFLTVSL